MIFMIITIDRSSLISSSLSIITILSLSILAQACAGRPSVPAVQSSRLLHTRGT